MLFISIAILLSVVAITLFGININVTTSTVYPEAKEVKADDIFDKEGDIKAEFEGQQVTMDEYIQSINSLMVDDDREIN